MEQTENYIWIIDSENQGQRIDKFVADQFSDWSRSQVQNWIKEGNVLVNDKTVKANYSITLSDEIKLAIPEQKELSIEAENIPLNIVFEDKDVIVINKPRGMTVHPAPGHYTGTLVNALMYHCKDLSGINGVLRPGIVHRIDKDTSGLLMVAKNDLAHRSLAEQLNEHSANRIYVALVHGNLPHEKGVIDAPIGRDVVDRKRMVVTDKNSKKAITHFSVIERFDGFTLVKCKLETGRTHQIRVHMKYIGYPLVGDPIYGQKKSLKIAGQALHAKTLGFKHPRTKEYLEFNSDLPEDMMGLIERLRIK